MYAQLKQIMTNHGYKPSAGDGWLGTDTREFDTFLHFVLGAPFGVANRFLAYPTAFPELLTRLDAVNHEAAEEIAAMPQAAAAPIAQDAAPQDAQGPDTEVVETPAPVDQHVDQLVESFDLTPQGQEDKQELPEASTETAEAPEASETDTGTETSEGDEANNEQE